MESIIDEGKNITRRTTNNFVMLRDYNGSEADAFKVWKDKMITDKIPVAYDRRNNIYCVAPSMDFEMYYNYLQYLNSCSKDWLSYGYLDMGMVPYLMWPSFLEDSGVLEHMKAIAMLANVNLVPVPSVSFLKPSYVSNGTDYWIFREDLVKLARFMEEKSPVYKFPAITGPDTATLTNFIKPLADYAKSLRGGV